MSDGTFGDDPWSTVRFVNLATSWDFEEHGRFLWTYLLSKLNTELHGKSVPIESRNGFELYRTIVKHMDDIPENAGFLLGAEITAMAEKFGPKVKDLKTLYGFRLLLKKRAAEFKKTVGEEVEESKMHEIIWNVMDPASKMIASQLKVHATSFQALGIPLDVGSSTRSLARILRTLLALAPSSSYAL